MFRLSAPASLLGQAVVALLASPILACNPNIEVFSSAPQPDGGPPIDPVFSNRVDLLLVVDNSPSMADKQSVLALTVPDLVEGLTNPACVDSNDVFVDRPAPGTLCPEGSSRLFPPVVDLHIAVISSSLGGHGSDSCTDVPAVVYDPSMEDNAHLLCLDAAGGEVPTYQSRGFLSWDPVQRKTPPGLSDRDTLTQRFVNILDGVGQLGCGYESTLEAWYRFLLDPSPRDRMVPAACHPADTNLSCREPSGVDTGVLQQRADFLRPDSLVAVLMLSDENDCSVKEGGQYYRVLQQSTPMARGTAACESAPGSPDCRSCWEVFDYTAHPECQTGWEDESREDHTNLRCFRQKQRFGIDFLHETQRYVSGLTRPKLDDGRVNPLFCSFATADGRECEGPGRDPTQVVLAGIVGVPWQDIAKDPKDLAKGYVTWSDVPWDVILGDPTSWQEPSDPLMVESVVPRSGVNPATGTALATPASPPGTPGANPINGFEREIPGGGELQYACIFDLPQPIDCTEALVCDCANAPVNPLCWDEAQQRYGSVQFRGKAYPGIRHLEVLRGMEAGGVIASICPANLSDPDALDFAYRPAVSALLDRLRLNLAAKPSP